MINFQSSGKRTLKNLAAGKLKIDVLDCTLANGSVTPTIPGINWIPIKPATNAAFCAALVQKIIADKTYNADAISFTTQKAAVEGGYGAYTNATYLVIVDENHPNYRKLMRASTRPRRRTRTARRSSSTWSSTLPPGSRRCTPRAARARSSSRAR